MSLNSLLCRHDYYWSERHRSDRCRRCGRTKVADPIAAEPLGAIAPAVPALEAIPVARGLPVAPRHRPSAKVMRAQAASRRASLLDDLDRLADGGELTRTDMINTLLALIEDAHSADPVLFGADAARHFARLHEARDELGATRLPPLPAHYAERSIYSPNETPN